MSMSMYMVASAAALSRSAAHCSGLNFFTKFQPHTRVAKISKVKVPLFKVPGLIIQKALPLLGLKNCAAIGSNGIHNISYDDNFAREPFWASLTKDVIWCLRTLFLFLAEQPSQLKYIEWPSFQGTLKTVTLTLVIVAFLIVALCSVDSALCYILAWFSRKSAQSGF